MTDRELLELAAKAAGMTLGAWHENYGVFMYRDAAPGRGYWNPLTDDGDALRLAVKCNISVILFNDGNVRAVWHDAEGELQEESAKDDYAATRRAIVRAAAEIAKAEAA